MLVAADDEHRLEPVPVQVGQELDEELLGAAELILGDDAEDAPTAIWVDFRRFFQHDRVTATPYHEGRSLFY